MSKQTNLPSSISYKLFFPLPSCLSPLNPSRSILDHSDLSTRVRIQQLLEVGLRLALEINPQGSQPICMNYKSTLDRIPSTTPGADPPRDARDSGSARSHSTHLETSSSDRP